MEEEKENEEKPNGPLRFTETKLEKGVACVTCNRRRYTNEEKLNVLMGLHRPRKQNKRKRVACVSFRPSATRWHTAARATNRNPPISCGGVRSDRLVVRRIANRNGDVEPLLLREAESSWPWTCHLGQNLWEKMNSTS